jgi:hypothetical protein
MPTPDPLLLELNDLGMTSPPLGLVPVSPSGEPEIPGSAIWQEGQIDTHNGLVFGGFFPAQHHVAVRAGAPGNVLTLFFHGHVAGRARMIAFLAFRGAPVVPEEAHVSAHCVAHIAGFAPHEYDVEGHLLCDPALPPPPLVPVVIDVDTGADIGPGLADFTLTYNITCTNVDPDHPPVLVGVRMIPHP